MATPAPRPLLDLARLHGIQRSFVDVTGARRFATTEALLSTLRALGVKIERPEAANRLIAERNRQLWNRMVGPACVAWRRRRSSVQVRLPAQVADGDLAAELVLESGERRKWLASIRELRIVERATIDGSDFLLLSMPLPAGLPVGYHQLRIEAGGTGAESLLIVAPRRAYGRSEREWGVFLPLYALRTDRSWGVGDFTDLAALCRWTASLGGTAVGTLPLLASYLDRPLEPSPYAPVSRLYWNELYVDPERAPELEHQPRARAQLISPAWRDEREALRAAPLVDYGRQMALKRAVLEKLAHAFHVSGGALHPEFEEFVERHPRLQDYAAFRATVERRDATWHQWPTRLREGTLKKGDYDERTKRYHVYVQWLAENQAAALANSDAGLYLDLPLGVHPDGYDVWRERHVFARGASGGAPPDDFFTLGQDWGFPPLHPEAVREDRYRYFRDVLRHHLRHARMLRIDHIMSMHRLYWVPHGLNARDGAYVRYRADEFYAILTLESHRYRATIVGEDLGTVPKEVRQAMSRHRVRRMHVVQFEMSPDPAHTIGDAPVHALATLNTHDMPPFASFWEEHDIADRLEMGLLDDEAAARERAQRARIREAATRFLADRGWLPSNETDTAAVARALFRHLAAGPAEFVLLSLEDLWLEKRPQNVPGTSTERPNWRRRAEKELDAIRRTAAILGMLEEIDRLRKGKADR